MATRVCIIRHGETAWNQEQRIQGQTDIPINQRGRIQAESVALKAAQYKFKAIYSSDLSRAYETARLLFEQAEHSVIRASQLRERHFGIFQGKLKEEIAHQCPEGYSRYLKRDIHYDFECGESILAFAKRSMAIFDELAAKHANQQIAVVCHAGLLDIMYRHVTGRSLESERDFVIPNCALNWFHHDGTDWHLDTWNDHLHLGSAVMDSVE